IEKYMLIRECPACRGRRLRPEVLAVKIAGLNIAEVSEFPVGEAVKFFLRLSSGQVENLSVPTGRQAVPTGRQASAKSKLSAHDLKIAVSILKEISRRLKFLIDVGLDYLNLARESTTLAGGEIQRIRLATQIGSGLCGVIYILDEPSVGLHSRDQERLIKILKELRDLGNSVIVVEHDEQTIRAADWVIDVGPGAGERGGEVIFEGTPRQLLKAKTLTGEYLSGRKKVEVSRPQNPKSKILNPKSPLPAGSRQNAGQIQNSKFKIQNYLEIKGAAEHNLKNINVKIPLGAFVCFSGVSGSGKSTLLNDILARALMRHFYDSKAAPGNHKKILGLEHIDKVVIVDQSPIGRTPRSNPATYTGAFGHIRELFAKINLARMRGYNAGRFSFNVKGGRCEACEGQGLKRIEMYFLPDVYVKCEECGGTRYNKEALEIEYDGKNIAQILEMSAEEALGFFKNIPPLRIKLQTLFEVGLGYLKLGQPAPSLSGGEAQRIKLAAELSKKETGRTLYILDEPTTGLHFDDIKKLLQVLRGLSDKGNSVLVIEHNLDVLKNSDWIIDLGPEGGDKGGEIVAEGTPADIAKGKKGYTGQYLKKIRAF
ncbi:MAG: excinuclease ABC subunit UvrA, partial [bacterium]|nr:excinuclease ABC subunit UvrA [bacterium]